MQPPCFVIMNCEILCDKALSKGNFDSFVWEKSVYGADRGAVKRGERTFDGRRMIVHWGICWIGNLIFKSDCPNALKAFHVFFLLILGHFLIIPKNNPKNPKKSQSLKNPKKSKKNIFLNPKVDKKMENL